MCKVQLANYTYAKYWLVMYQKAKYLMCRLQVGKVHTGKSPCAKYNWQTTHVQSTSQSKYQLAKFWLVKYDRQNRRCAKYYTGKLTGVQPTNDRLTTYWQPTDWQIITGKVPVCILSAGKVHHVQNTSRQYIGRQSTSWQYMGRQSSTCATWLACKLPTTS